MIEELKGLELENTFSGITKGTKFPLEKLSRRENHPPTVFMVDYFEYLKTLEYSNKISISRDTKSELNQIHFDNANLINLIDKRIHSAEDLNKLMNNIYDNRESFKNILKGYRTFVAELELIQLEWLSRYIPHNKSNPIFVIPFSYGLNRLNYSVDFIKFIEKENPDILDNPNQKLSSIFEIEDDDFKYKCKETFLDDNCSRVNFETSIRVYYYNKSNDIFTDTWEKAISTNLNKNKQTSIYNYLIPTIREVYAQYALNGKAFDIDFNPIDIYDLNFINTMFFVNYPFKCKFHEKNDRNLLVTDN